MDNEIISRLDSIDKRLTVIEQLLSGDTLPRAIPQSTPRPLSIAEYVLSKNPNDDNQRTLVLASYLETYREQSDFTADDLRQAFIDGRLKTPANISDKTGKLAKKGLIMQVGEREGRKAWRLTMSGISQLEKGYGE